MSNDRSGRSPKAATDNSKKPNVRYEKRKDKALSALDHFVRLYGTNQEAWSLVRSSLKNDASPRTIEAAHAEAEKLVKEGGEGYNSPTNGVERNLAVSLSDTGPIVKGKGSDVDQVMKEAEEQAAKRAEEKAAAAAIAVAQRFAEAQATEAVHEEGEIACLLEKKARSGGWFFKRDQERLSVLEHDAAKRAEARAARDIAEAKTAHALSAPAADKVDLSLLWAAENGREAMVKMLLDTGKVDLDAKDETGQTHYDSHCRPVSIPPYSHPGTPGSSGTSKYFIR
ncbi:hypothetical protein FPOAC2_04022 [Fusarium poae]